MVKDEANQEPFLRWRKPHSKYQHVFPITRVWIAEFPIKDMYDINNLLTIVKVMSTEEEAISEVKRLNDLQKDEEYIYVYEGSLLIP